MQIISIKQIWNRAKHNALADLVYFRDQFFCVLREADSHAGGQNGKVRILKSANGGDWQAVALLQKKGVDLRDPMFSITPDQRLMLTLGGSFFRDGRYISCQPHVSFSENGIEWQKPLSLVMDNEWIWRVTWYQGQGYGVSYRITDPSNLKKRWIATLFKTEDGIHYEPITSLSIAKRPSEVTLRFLPDGSMIALARRSGDGWIGIAAPPYKKWSWNSTGYLIGGPNFLILPNGKMIAATRLYFEKNQPMTALSWMNQNFFQPALLLPSGGDNSYPGMVYLNGMLYISYYSSHEGKTMIYFAKIKID